MSTPSHHYPLRVVPLSAKAYRPVGVIARTLLTASLILMVTGCAWHSSQEGFGSYYASAAGFLLPIITLLGSKNQTSYLSLQKARLA